MTGRYIVPARLLTWVQSPVYSCDTLRFVKLFVGATAVLIASLYPLQSYANRPAMAEEEPTEETVPDDAPSAVEIMMQQKQHQQQTGDVLVMPPKEIQPGEVLQVKVIDTPRRGASKDKVRKLLGEPLSMTPSVGDPPISSWVYSDRIVYFEYSSVIHVVARN